MASKNQLDPKNFPRPPKLEQCSRHLQIKWNDNTIADTKDGYWVLETYHPPTYYIPRASLKVPLTASASRQTYCEYKGRASYWDIALPSPDGTAGETVKSRIWSYEDPNPSFKDLKGHLCFYAEPWDCYVDGERVVPQPGDYYGGWVTSDIKGDWIKGAPGTTHW